MINGTYARDIVPMAKNFKYVHYLEQRRKYALRGGIFEQITLENSLKAWIESAAKTVNIRPVVNVFEPKQTMDLIDDWRNLLINLPGIGEQKAMDIFNWLDNKSFYGFLNALENGNIKEVAGIGPATIEKIKIYLKGK
jgi:ERCC4-type nuclease